jgi:hypothetical protein
MKNSFAPLLAQLKQRSMWGIVITLHPSASVSFTHFNLFSQTTRSIETKLVSNVDLHPYSFLIILLSAGLIIISSLSCISLRADLSACVKLSVLGTCTSTLCLISDLSRSTTDSSLVFLLCFGIQLLFLINLGIAMTSFMSDSSVDRSSLVSFFQWKYSLISNIIRINLYSWFTTFISKI